MIKYSVIIPVYNENSVIKNCLESLDKQTVRKEMEIIVVDDGSTDKSKGKSQKVKVQFKIQNFLLLTQNHAGPGAARNFGAAKAKGEILVFVDADMEFASDFVEKLCQPILHSQGETLRGEIIGTFSKDEYLLNKDNVWARYWNINLGRPADRMVSTNYPNEAPVFLAILRDKFLSVGGFDTNVGYTDDWSISRKLEVKSVAATGAVFYHRNPDTLKEVWSQARWFGKNEFLTGSLIRKTYNLARYNPVLAIFTLPDTRFFIFKIVYNAAVFYSVLLSFFGEHKNK